MTLEIIILILFTHFLSDFILQSDWMAQNKSKSNKALLIHTLTYSFPFLLLFGFKYAILNMILHTIIDYFSSRVSSKLAKSKQWHWFFAVIGFDQFLHYVCLFTTYVLMIK